MSNYSYNPCSTKLEVFAVFALGIVSAIAEQALYFMELRSSVFKKHFS